MSDVIGPNLVALRFYFRIFRKEPEKIGKNRKLSEIFRVTFFAFFGTFLVMLAGRAPSQSGLPMIFGAVDGDGTMKSSARRYILECVGEIGWPIHRSSAVPDSSVLRSVLLEDEICALDEWGRLYLSDERPKPFATWDGLLISDPGATSY